MTALQLQLLTRLLLAGVLCLLAWQVVATASTPELESSALIRVVEGHVGSAGKNADWAEVAALARRALEANPLETRALVLLALVAEAAEDDREAVRLVSLAAPARYGTQRPMAGCSSCPSDRPIKPRPSPMPTSSCGFTGA